MPRYGFLLDTLIGLNTNRPEVCHGMRHVPAPCSIAVMIWSVTRAYTSRYSVAVLSEVDIRETNLSRVFRGRAKLVA